MIRRLLSCVAVLSALIQLSASERVILWQSEAPEGVSLSWSNGGINISPESCTEFMVGGKIEIRLNMQEGAILKLCYDKPVDGWTDLLSFPLEGENPVRLHEPFDDFGFLELGMPVVDILDGFKYLLHCLQVLFFIRMPDLQSGHNFSCFHIMRYKIKNGAPDS